MKTKKASSKNDCGGAKSDPLGLAAGDDNRPTEADAYLRALIDYTGGFYSAAIAHGMKPGPAADAVQHVERAARNLHRLAADDNHKALVEALQDAKEADTYERGCEILELAVTAFLARKEEK